MRRATAVARWIGERGCGGHWLRWTLQRKVAAPPSSPPRTASAGPCRTAWPKCWRGCRRSARWPRWKRWRRGSLPGAWPPASSPPVGRSSSTWHRPGRRLPPSATAHRPLGELLPVRHRGRDRGHAAARDRARHRRRTAWPRRGLAGQGARPRLLRGDPPRRLPQHTRWICECSCGGHWLRWTLQRKVAAGRVCAKCREPVVWRRNVELATRESV